MTTDGRFVEVQGTAEGEPYDRAELDAMLDLAAAGIEGLAAAQTEVLHGG
jgi:ribonuclease PH